MLNLGINKIKEYIRSIGLFNKKSKNIIDICKIILYKHKGIIPNNRISLESLPGIGRKTTNIILNILFGHNTIAVDTHVLRVSNRTKFATGDTPKLIEKKLLNLTTNRFKKNIHNWFFFHGKYVCKSKNFNCKFCIIKDLCEYNKKIFI